MQKQHEAENYNYQQRRWDTWKVCVFFFFFLSWKMKTSFLARLVRQKEYGGQENVPEPNCRLHFLINYGLLNALVLSPVK